jgi:hypothetical protein
MTALTTRCTNLLQDIIQATPTKIDAGIKFHARGLRTFFKVPHLVDDLIGPL